MSLQAERERFNSQTSPNSHPTNRDPDLEHLELEQKEEDAYKTVKWYGWYHVALLAIGVIVGFFAYLNFFRQ